MHAEEGTPEDMEVAARMDTPVTLEATEENMKIIPVAITDASQPAQRGVVTSRTSAAARLVISLWRIAPNSMRNNGRRFLLKRPAAVLSPGLSSPLL